MAATRLELNMVRLLSRCEAMAAERRDPAEWRLEKVRAPSAPRHPDHRPLQHRHPASEYRGSTPQYPGWAPHTSCGAAPQYPRFCPSIHCDSAPPQPPTRPPQYPRFCSSIRLRGNLGRWTHREVESPFSPLCSCRGLPSDEKQSAVELDAVLQHHQDMQEKLAEEMLSLARSLKNNTLAAQNVIKQDNQTLSHSLRMADQNFEKLKDESDRLEQHAKKSVNWLLWIMLIVVCFIFISMILFIRIFPKLK
ncbi:USE1 protein, partial [Xiphorhynchus elegans]|nr:USE1 protein [Xiphorhynchus elegans]